MTARFGRAATATSSTPARRTRHWTCEVHLVGGTGKPGGVGELCVPAAAGAVANAYARATGDKPRNFPINF